MAGHQLTPKPDRDFAEVDLGLAAGQVGLRDERLRLAAALLDADLRPPRGDVGPDDGVGDVAHAVLGAEPIEDPCDRVPLFARRV